MLASVLIVAGHSGCAGRGQAGTALVLEVPESDRDADVYVDGNYVGQVDALDDREGLGHLRLAPGTHRVEIRKPGHFPVQKTIRVDRRPPPATVVDAELLEDPQ